MQLVSDTNFKEDLEGAMSIKFKSRNAFNEYCAGHIPNYNTDRFEILAIRLYFGKETAVTVYAVDKDRMGRGNFSEGKIPVKKFRLNNILLTDILSFIDECNFTLTTGIYPLGDMEVVNK